MLLITSLSGAVAADNANIVQVRKDGQIVCPTNAATARFAPAGKAATVCYDFGLPRIAASERWLEGGAPILQTLWETGGVKYTQKVLLTRLGKGDPPVSPDEANAVLMVQIFGQSVAGEYTNATATFAVRAADLPLNLELDGDRIFLLGLAERVLLGVVDVAGSGIVGTNGPQLRFAGNMPPGTTGALTIKIPAGIGLGDDQLDRLRDLDFDEELQRVKKFWKNRPGPPINPPVAWEVESRP